MFNSKDRIKRANQRITDPRENEGGAKIEKKSPNKVRLLANSKGEARQSKSRDSKERRLKLKGSKKRLPSDEL